MIVDTSAILAILFEEDDAELYARALTQADSCRMSAANFVEAAIVVDAQTKDKGSRQFDAFFRRAAIAIEPVSEEQRMTRDRPTPTSERAGTPRASTSATASPMHSQR